MYDRPRSALYKTVLRVLFGALLVTSFLLFVLWRTENPRLLQIRAAVTDLVAPTLNVATEPATGLERLVRDISAYGDLQRENERLRREVLRLRNWREVAQQLEEENARLRALNQVKLPPRVSFVTAEVVADAGGPYAQSVLVNVGARDGVRDGAPVLDEGGLVGRVAGVGDRSARVLLLTDRLSRTPVHVGAERRRAVLTGGAAGDPRLEFVFDDRQLELGASVLTSGDGRVFPAGLQVGRIVALDEDGPKVRLSADLDRLEFLRILRSGTVEMAPPEPGLIRRLNTPEPTTPQTLAPDLTSTGANGAAN